MSECTTLIDMFKNFGMLETMIVKERDVEMKVTEENALDFYHAMLFCRAADRLRYISGIYPEILSFTHGRIAELIGMERETVTRTIKKIRKGQDNQAPLNSLC